MGCDIHATVEYDKYRNDSRGNTPCWWDFCNDIDIERDYRLFSALAGVRGLEPEDPQYERPISGPRGVPEDASYRYEDLVRRWEGDGHSHSWLTADELRLLPEGMREEDWYRVVDMLALKYGGDAVRLCFFFDN